MNERIKQLAEQAGYKDLPTVRLAFYSFDKEKFAQLIVRECIEALDENDGSVHHSECLLEHFGVEE